MWDFMLVTGDLSEAPKERNTVMQIVKYNLQKSSGHEWVKQKALPLLDILNRSAAELQGILHQGELSPCKKHFSLDYFHLCSSSYKVLYEVGER
ncbi:hypothetical protein NQZ68_007270 [Dissostichus eleginoides]|nr:hypothetical protein NQZ68_007270 [Dissostichus eleginoides]